MRPHVLMLAAVLAGPAALAADAPASSVNELSTARTTASGQPITAPPGPMQVTASIAVIPPGGATPVHRHPFLRYDYVLEGRLQVTNLDTGKVDVVKAGDFVVDPVGQWHQGRALDGKGVRLLVIDQAPPGQSNTVLKDAPP